MDRRGCLETGAITLAAGLATVGVLQASPGGFDWSLLLGVLVGTALAAAANYRARTGHAEQVADTAPNVVEGRPGSAADPTEGPGSVEPTGDPAAVRECPDRSATSESDR